MGLLFSYKWWTHFRKGRIEIRLLLALMMRRNSILLISSGILSTALSLILISFRNPNPSGKIPNILPLTSIFCVCEATCSGISVSILLERLTVWMDDLFSREGRRIRQWVCYWQSSYNYYGMSWSGFESVVGRDIFWAALVGYTIEVFYFYYSYCGL